MNSLINYLDYASSQYYNGSPIISDEVFDALAASVNYSSVGAKAAGKVEKHYYRLYSLQKYYEGESKKPLVDERDLVCSVKLDGAAVSHLYVDGHYVRSLTRGDGIEGQVVTEKFRDGRLIPLTIPLTGIVQVDGELVAPINIENARNYAAGALNLKDVEEFKSRTVEFIAYQVTGTRLNPWYDVDMKGLAKAGFSTCLDKNLDKIFPSDGLVFRVNSNSRFKELGYTSKHPRGAYALKERQEHVETELLAVEWQVGKTGKVTPVAILEPVMIGDAEVSRATLNNPGFIEALGICIGDTVAVVRAGEVIPCVTHKVDE